VTTTCCRCADSHSDVVVQGEEASVEKTRGFALLCRRAGRNSRLRGCLGAESLKKRGSSPEFLDLAVPMVQGVVKLRRRDF